METKKTEKRGETVVLLDYPIPFGEETISEIVLKRPKFKHIKNMGEGMKIKDLIQIASKVSAVPMAVFEEMESPDVMKIAEALGELL